MNYRRIANYYDRFDEAYRGVISSDALCDIILTVRDLCDLLGQYKWKPSIVCAMRSTTFTFQSIGSLRAWMLEVGLMAYVGLSKDGDVIEYAGKIDAIKHYMEHGS